MRWCPCKKVTVQPLAYVPEAIPPVVKPKVEIVLVNTSNDQTNMNHCFEALQGICAQNHVARYISFENAFDHIHRLERTTSVILISMGNKHKKLYANAPDLTAYPNVRNLFIYVSENENFERFRETTVQHVFGERHLFAAVRDALEGISASPNHEYSPQNILFALHESSINALLIAIKSIQFQQTIMGKTLTFNLSQMSVKLSSGMFQFCSHVELVGSPWILSGLTSRPVYGNAELALKNQNFVIVVNHFVIEFPKMLGRYDLAKSIPSIPLDSIINFGHSQELPNYCETKQLILVPKNLKIVVEEKLVKLFIEMEFIPMANANRSNN